ncbi:heme-containing dehydratase [Penicillium vulpinum]|uniref:heme-containing dehydratase n=1 Tax=Penicillium vulpinum TaxID=29845 RepID=UPI002547A18A|nr:heme-containing dehydratase [Penicillium vulpinum]KAJ5960796.1 heme-containing dehydratase [Penicillium vulpinum]
MWGVKFANDEPFVISIFGIQYPTGEPTDDQEHLTDEFNALMNENPVFVYRLMKDGRGSISAGKTFIWLTYWKTHGDYKAWWEQEDVSHFWKDLPSESGMWREVMKPSPRRSQYGTNQTYENGMGQLGTRVSLGEKSSYWGCYRHRMADSSVDKFASPTPGSKPICPRAPESNLDRPGRVQHVEIADNLCFVVEGQDHTELLAEERNHWFENFDGSFNQWVKDLVDAGPEAGILDARLCYEPGSGTFCDSEPRALSALQYNKKVQLFYFKDLSYMERIGRLNKGHVDMRKRFLESYGSEGEMKDGKICLWVETVVLKADEVECEYIGCAEGTGFMPTIVKSSI